jgi:hypothetical protein
MTEKCDFQCLKCRTPDNTIITPRSSAGAIISSSCIWPPGVKRAGRTRIDHHAQSFASRDLRVGNANEMVPRQRRVAPVVGYEHLDQIVKVFEGSEFEHLGENRKTINKQRPNPYGLATSVSVSAGALVCLIKSCAARMPTSYSPPTTISNMIIEPASGGVTSAVPMAAITQK